MGLKRLPKLNNQPIGENVWNKFSQHGWWDATDREAKGNMPLSTCMFCVNSLGPSESHLGGNPLKAPSKEHEHIHSSTVCKNGGKNPILNAHQYGVIKLIMASESLLNLNEGYMGIHYIILSPPVCISSFFILRTF